MNKAKLNPGALVVIPDVKIEQVEKTYNGKARACCCGCAGSYAYAKVPEKDGHTVDVKPKAVKYAVDKINKALKGDFPVDVLIVDPKFVSIDVGNKTYTAYLY